MKIWRIYLNDGHRTKLVLETSDQEGADKVAEELDRLCGEKVCTVRATRITGKIINPTEFAEGLYDFHVGGGH